MITQENGTTAWELFHSYPAAAASDLSPAYIDQVPGTPPEEETLFTPPPKALAAWEPPEATQDLSAIIQNQFWTISKLNYNQFTPIWQPVSK